MPIIKVNTTARIGKPLNSPETNDFSGTFVKVTEESIPEQELESSIKDEEEEKSAGTPVAELKMPSIEKEDNDSVIVKRKEMDLFAPAVENNITETTEVLLITCESPDRLKTEEPEPDLTSSDANL